MIKYDDVKIGMKLSYTETAFRETPLVSEVTVEAIDPSDRSIYLSSGFWAFPDEDSCMTMLIGTLEPVTPVTYTRELLIELAKVAYTMGHSTGLTNGNWNFDDWLSRFNKENPR